MHADLVLFGRIVLAAALGYAVGWEREYRKSTAGDRTFALVAIGAAGITGIGAEFYPASAEKVIAGVVTGLGFLGAGIIFRSESGQPLGLTTAASLWATAGAGIVAGAGRYLLAVLMALLILGLLELGHAPAVTRFDAKMRMRSPDDPSPPR
jgi:putative Mg2+ transporter-C (MgtC) family protein